MATINNSGHRQIISDREFEDYKSMKEYFRSKWIRTKEIVFEGHQLATTSFAVIDGAEDTIVLIAAEAVVYLSTLADDANQDGKSVWVIYQDDSGTIQTTILTLLDDQSDTSIEVPLGCEAGTKLDTVASVAGDALTMTNLNSTVANEFDDMYVVGVSGDQKGNVLTVLSHTVASPTVLTCTTTPNANWAADIVSVQTYKAEDFFRVREMYCELETIDAKTIRLGNDNSSAIYGSIGETARYMASSGFFTQPVSICRSFLGKINISMPVDTTVTENVGGSISITYTPKEAYSNGGTADITIEIPFQGQFVWEPCIELAPATDVIIKIKNIEGAKLDEIFLEAIYLEAYN
ncbi:hypothetical protein LCGC14_0712240 [marine sediment metagenome]|uniref:Uncharacterized protein n=1 Tax=marine sediment metagenome TaxID=412755 RepID=A0A0F9TM93_9ZZZZ